MKVSIIGGSGFVGTRLIKLLNEDKSIDTRNIDKQQSHFFPGQTTIANVLDKEAMINLLKGQDLVVLLAAEHRDDVTPKSLYYEVNVQGMKNVLEAMDVNGLKRIVFTSSVAVYGLNKENPKEEHPKDPFNEYGRTKWQAEKALEDWHKRHPENNVNILRPTVIFGERNRGNVYNLLRQIASGKFLMIGSGNNKKSMAYVGNIVGFIEFLIKSQVQGYNVYNYIDKPDYTMNELVKIVGKVLGKHTPTSHVPYWAGMLGGYSFDVLSKISGKKMTISSVRVKKFCATTQFDSSKAMETGFTPPFNLAEGLSNTLKYEFIDKKDDNEVVFYSE